MKKIARNELLPYNEYTQVHDRFLQRVIQEKKLRRIPINDRMTGLFETRLTVWFQIQEMIRAEEISREEYLEEMLEIYNDLLPEDHELSMTLFIEIPNREALRSFNKQVVGIENHLALRFGEETVHSYEPGEDMNADEHYTQSVHYLRFPFKGDQISRFHSWDGEVSLHVTHPSFTSKQVVPQELVASLKKNLTADSAIS